MVCREQSVSEIYTVIILIKEVKTFSNMKVAFDMGRKANLMSSFNSLTKVGAILLREVVLQFAHWKKGAFGS